MLPFTAHILVRNEDQFLKYALDSVMPLSRLYFIYDTGSTDKTLEILKEYKYEQKGPQTPAGITKLRNEMIEKTRTSWFLVVDGDEVWNREMLKNYLEFTAAQPRNIMATFLRTRNCVGDIYHYRSEKSGRYEIAGMKGHLNIRAYRRLQNFLPKWTGDYPLEKCVDPADKNSVAFFEGYYWHMTHLKRSSSEDAVSGFRKRVYDLGIKVKDEEIPEVLKRDIKKFPHRPLSYEFLSLGAEIARIFK